MSDRLRVPSYRCHKQSGKAIVTLTDGFGDRRDVLLGPHGTKASRIEYARVISEWEASGRRLPKVDLGADLTINELILAYWRFVEENFRRPGGAPSKTLENVKFDLRTLRELYGHTSAGHFGPRALKAVQQCMEIPKTETAKVLVIAEVKGEHLRVIQCGDTSCEVSQFGKLERLFRWNEWFKSVEVYDLKPDALTLKVVYGIYNNIEFDVACRRDSGKAKTLLQEHLKKHLNVQGVEEAKKLLEEWTK